MTYTRVPGVYEVRNTLDNKVYIGSSVNTSARMAVHRQQLTKGKHCSKHMQAAWDKHGAENFRFKLLLVCSPKDLVFYEQRLVDGYRAMEPAFGYNKRVVVQSNAGVPLSEEHKRKISASLGRGKDHHNFGKPLCAEAYVKAAALKKMYGLTEETKAKLSKALKGKKKPEGFGEKIGNAKRGVPATAEARRNMCLGRVGFRPSKTHKENIGKLDYAKASEMRALAASGVGPHEKLAEMFGVSRGRVSAILRGESWV